TAARSGRRRSGAHRRRQAGNRGCAGGCSHASRSGSPGTRRKISPRLVSPDLRFSSDVAAVAQQTGGHSGAGRTFFRASECTEWVEAGSILCGGGGGLAVI